MSNELLFLLAFVAIIIGWFLGKFPFKRVYLYFRHRSWQRSYLEVLRLLLHEQTDHAIENFIDNWPVDSKTVELHNLLAIMLRKKGEVERAVRIHTSIVECRKLTKQQQLDATIELAYDYIASGLLDRAERLLINLINHDVTHDERVLELLQNIYQTEKEWAKAIAVAEQLLAKKTIRLSENSQITPKQANDNAHYYCELAELALSDFRYSDAIQALDAALFSDQGCARANMLKAQLLINKGQVDQAIQALDAVDAQDANVLPECLGLLKQCYGGDLLAYLHHLQSWQQQYPSSAIESELIAVLSTLGRQQEAEQAMLMYVERRPTLQGLRKLAELQLSHSEASPYNRQIFQLLDTIVQHKPLYRCGSCGFSGMQLHWNCPQCQQWDTIRRHRGSEGD